MLPLATAGTVKRNRSEANPSIRAPSEGLARKTGHETPEEPAPA